MKSVGFESVTPLYQQIYDILYEEIEKGVYAPGGRIPSEDKLCSMYHVSRVTVRAALKKLTENGALVKKHGKGTFVAQSVFSESVNAKGSFTKSCEQMGVIPKTKRISVEMKKTTKNIRKILGIEGDTEVICINRLRMVDGIPAIFEVDYFSEKHKYMLDADVETKPLRETIFHHSGLEIKKYKDMFDVTPVSKLQSKWLNCSQNEILLCVHQTVYADMDEVLYYNEEYIRSDIYKYVTEH